MRARSHPREHAYTLACLLADVPAAMLACMSTNMRPWVLAVALQKGGVGKTTTVINLAVEWALLGLRVLVIDLDQQANATKGLGVVVDDDAGTMYEVLHDNRDDRMPLREVIVPTAFGVDVAPAALAQRKLERTGLGAGGHNRLAREIETLAGGYDVVVIDCPPSLGELTTAGITAADDVLATVAPGPDELEALVELGKTVMDVQESLNANVDIRFVLTTNYDGRTQTAKDVRRNLARDWPDEYLGEISSTVRVKEAKGMKLPIAKHSPASTAADDYRTAARKIAERKNLNV